MEQVLVELFVPVELRLNLRKIACFRVFWRICLKHVKFDPQLALAAPHTHSVDAETKRTLTFGLRDMSHDFQNLFPVELGLDFELY